MYKLEGISVTTGIAIGKAHIIKERAYVIEDYLISDDEVQSEIDHFHNSINAVISEIDEYKKNFELSRADEAIIETHRMILLDPDFHSAVVKLIRDDKKNLEQAVYQHFTQTINYFQNLDNELYAERALDYEDVYRRLIMQLKKIDHNDLDDIKSGECIVMNDIPPSMVSQVYKKGITGIILAKGTKTSHSIIIARALGLPIITGVKWQHIIHSDDVLCIDAKKGFVVGNPPDETFSEFIALQQKIKQEVDELIDYIDLLPTTANCEQLRILSNIELPIEIDHILELKSDGVGLFRTEFFYLNRQSLPAEEEQFVEYKMIAEKLGRNSEFGIRSLECQSPEQHTPNTDYRNFTIRTIDIGGDKVAGWYSASTEANPNLGCRGIRFSLRYKNIFKTQLRAILRASHFGNIQIMFPMIATVEEFIAAKAIIEECKEELRAEGKPFDEDIKVGTMIETPSAALCSKALAQHSDFFSIGTNDLLQYTVAVDRNNDTIAEYYNPYNPAFLHLVLRTIQSAKKHKIPVAVCGELAADTEFIPFLLNAGVKELSIGINHTLSVRKFIRSVDTEKAIHFVNEIYECNTIEEAKRFIQKIKNICVGE